MDACLRGVEAFGSGQALEQLLDETMAKIRRAEQAASRRAYLLALLNREVAVGLGRMFAFYYCSSTAYQIH